MASNTEKREKREMHTVGLGIWRKTDQKGKGEAPIVVPGIW